MLLKEVQQLICVGKSRQT